nr:MAG TPA: hypothetical protein [Caudoviricetes sp.]
MFQGLIQGGAVQGLGVGAADQIVDADAEIVRQADERFAVRAGALRLVVGDGLLVDADGIGNVDLAQVAVLAQVTDSVHLRCPLLYSSSILQKYLYQVAVLQK